MRAAALQYVRKVSGSQKPSKANEAVFARAVEEVAAITSTLLAELVTIAPPRDRELEAARARARAEKRSVTPLDEGTQVRHRRLEPLRRSRLRWSHERAIALLHEDSGSVSDTRCVDAVERVRAREHGELLAVAV